MCAVPEWVTHRKLAAKMLAEREMDAPRAEQRREVELQLKLHWRSLERLPELLLALFAMAGSPGELEQAITAATVLAEDALTHSFGSSPALRIRLCSGDRLEVETENQSQPDRLTQLRQSMASPLREGALASGLAQLSSRGMTLGYEVNGDRVRVFATCALESQQTSQR